ncbi:uncharacterized protein LOC132285224 [Cornus florida]|uniref:uncharacterized protein LOC132285224 n=1 Tax=Cornus florida TaxID=4283 RepID=UPI00289EF5C3|nr:uncharacterized protein LOC132285224 [Cornus florida]
MKAVLLRTGSVPNLSIQPSFVPGSPRVPHFDLYAEKKKSVSPKISLHLEINRRNDTTPVRSIRRVMSESDVIRSESEVSGCFSRLSAAGSRSFPVRIPEEEYVSDGEDGVGSVRSLFVTERGSDRRNYAGDWPEGGIPVEELGFSGGGIGKGRIPGGGGGGDDFEFGAFTGGEADRSKISAYYLEMLKSDPTNFLLLRNYGKFLHEVERDTAKAEEYYGRAILASPGDGEVLSLYGKLIWETEADEDRAKSYFDRAVHASPDDCVVLGSYAHFMWEAGGDEDEEEEIEIEGSKASPAMVAAF